MNVNSPNLLSLPAPCFRRNLPLFLIALIIMQAGMLHSPWLNHVRTDALAWGVLLAMAYGYPAWRRLEPTALTSRRLRYPALAFLFATTLAYSSFIYAATAMLVIALLAEANYRWVEKPLRAIGVRIAGRVLSGSRSTQANEPSPTPAQ